MPKRPKAMPKRLTKAPTPAINLPDELKAAAEILTNQRTKQNAEQQYALVVTLNHDQVTEVEDEFKREYSFIEQAKKAAAKALDNLKKLDIPTEVPKTYKGEMVKDDRQMARIRENLRSKKDAIEKSEKMKKLRELKKVGKKIQEEVLRKRSKDKKDFLEKVKKKPVSELFDD